jgi:hypothetical protein
MNAERIAEVMTALNGLSSYYKYNKDGNSFNKGIANGIDVAMVILEAELKMAQEAVAK